MLFNEFGEKGNSVILGMHGMLQNWENEYEMLKPLEKDFRLIIHAMDGMYPNSEFTSFADQARQIKEYVKDHPASNLYKIKKGEQRGK